MVSIVEKTIDKKRYIRYIKRRVLGRQVRYPRWIALRKLVWDIYLSYQYHYGCSGMPHCGYYRNDNDDEVRPTRWSYRQQIWPPGIGTGWLSRNSAGPTYSTSIAVRVTLTTCRLRVRYLSTDRRFRWIGYCATVSRHGPVTGPC